MAEAFFEEEKSRLGLKKIVTELEEVKDFYDAEEEHQQVHVLQYNNRGLVPPSCDVQCRIK